MGDGERDDREREREREREQSVSTTSKANIVYRVYNIAAGIAAHGEKLRGQANITSADCKKLQRDEVNEEKETEQKPKERL
jgi:hypothetical protein